MGGRAYGIDRHRFTPSRVKPSTVPDLMVARTTCSCMVRRYRTNGPRRAWSAITCRPASLGRYADCWADSGVCAGGGVFTLSWRGRPTDGAVVDGVAEHDARRTVDHVTNLDDTRPTSGRRGADRRGRRL